MPIRAVVFDAEDLQGESPAVAGTVAGRYVVGLVAKDRRGVDLTWAAGGFAFGLAADSIGRAQPDGRLLAMAAVAAGCHPSELVAVGGRAEVTVTAAQSIGGRGVWIDRGLGPCPAGLVPDATITSLAELPAVLDRFEAVEDAANAAVGVGPHPEPWPGDAHIDPELLARGDRRNVEDRYRYWREDAIVADLAAHAHPFHVAVENWRSDHNIGAVVRNANAFGAAGVHVVGRKRWNRRGAMATDRYLPVRHHGSVADLVDWATVERLEVVGIDNVVESVPLESTALPARSLLLFGQEGPGLSAEAIASCSKVVAITQFGSTRSVNAGVASGIAMHAWIRQHAVLPRVDAAGQG